MAYCLFFVRGRNHSKSPRPLKLHQKVKHIQQKSVTFSKFKQRQVPNAKVDTIISCLWKVDDFCVDLPPFPMKTEENMAHSSSVLPKSPQKPLLRTLDTYMTNLLIFFLTKRPMLQFCKQCPQYDLSWPRHVCCPVSNAPPQPPCISAFGAPLQ